MQNLIALDRTFLAGGFNSFTKPFRRFGWFSSGERDAVRWPVLCWTLVKIGAFTWTEYLRHLPNKQKWATYALRAGFVELCMRIGHFRIVVAAVAMRIQCDWYEKMCLSRTKLINYLDVIASNALSLHIHIFYIVPSALMSMKCTLIYL